MCNQNITALYFMGKFKTIIVFIPKKSKKPGVFEKAFGGSILNYRYEEFMKSELHIIDYNQVYDEAKYLSFGLNRNCKNAVIQDGIDEFKKVLEKIFPQIKNWREIDSKKFYSLI